MFNVKSVSFWNRIFEKFRYKYSKKELYEALNNPVILHCVFKPWFKKKIIILILGQIIIILSGGIMQKKRISIMKFFQNI